MQVAIDELHGQMQILKQKVDLRDEIATLDYVATAYEVLKTAIPTNNPSATPHLTVLSEDKK